MTSRCYTVFPKKYVSRSNGKQHAGFVHTENGKKVLGINEKISKKGLGREVNNVWFSSFTALRNKKWASVSLKPLKPYEDKTLDISRAEMTAANDKLPLDGFSTSQWIHRQRFPWAAWRLVWWVRPREVECPGSDSLDCQQHNHRTTRAWRSRHVSHKRNRPTVLSGQLCSSID